MSTLEMSPFRHEADFLAERQAGIGGSDAAALLNIGWGCRRRLWLKKTGVPPDYPHDTKAVMARGTMLEPIVRRIYCIVTDRSTIWHLARFVRHQYPFLFVHLDGWVYQTPSRADGGICNGVAIPLEIKTVGREAFYRIKREGLPPDYILQMQHALMVTVRAIGSYAVFWPDGWQLLWWDVERNEDIIANLEREGIAFWKTVEDRGPEPERLDPGDRRCRDCEYRTSCQGARLLDAAKADPASDVPFDESLGPLVEEFKVVHGVFDEAEEMLADVEARIKTALADRLVLDTTGARIYHTAIPVEQFTVQAHVKRPLRILAR